MRSLAEMVGFVFYMASKKIEVKFSKSGNVYGVRKGRVLKTSNGVGVSSSLFKKVGDEVYPK